MFNLGFNMFDEFKQFIKIFYNTIRSANKAVSPMYKLEVYLLLLLGSLILKNTGFRGMTGLVYAFALCSLMMLFKASFYYYWKSRKLERKLEVINK